MATIIEIDGLLHFKDETGNIYIVYPVTKAKNVEGLEEIKVTIDSALSDTSKNPVQNKVIKAEINKLIPKSGGTMTGKLTLSGEPTSNLHAATKQYVDTGLDEKVDTQDLTSHTGNKNNPHGVTAAQVGALSLTGGTMTGALTLSGNPTSNLHAVTKQYVDGLVPVLKTVTLSTSGWTASGNVYTKSVAVSGVSSNEETQMLFVTPSSASLPHYRECGIYASKQGTNSLTFTASKIPTSSLTVYVVIQDL